MEQFRSKHKQTQSEWEAEMSKKVLEFVRSELYMDCLLYTSPSPRD